MVTPAEHLVEALLGGLEEPAGSRGHAQQHDRDARRLAEHVHAQLVDAEHPRGEGPHRELGRLLHEQDLQTESRGVAHLDGDASTDVAVDVDDIDGVGGLDLVEEGERQLEQMVTVGILTP